MRSAVLLLAAALVAASLVAAAAESSGVVCTTPGEDSLTFVVGRQSCSSPEQLLVARAAFTDARDNPSNFGKLRVVANDSSIDNVLRYRAAGFAEGWLTAERIWHHFQNMKHYFETQLYPDVNLWDKPMRWLKAQEAWVQQAIAESKARPQPSTAPTGDAPAPGDVLSVLGATELLNAQFDGLVEGYAARVAHEQRLRAAAAAAASPGPSSAAAAPALTLQPLSRDEHLFMQNNGELYDIVDGMVAGVVDLPNGTVDSAAAGSLWKAGVRPEARRAGRAGRWLKRQQGAGAGGAEEAGEAEQRSAAAWLRRVVSSERCSAIIKVTGDLSDILIGHATWDSFTNALHIFKHYEFGAPGFGRLSFSSYPGETFSDDDFYLSESGLVVTETTNHIFNMDIYSALTVESLLSWQRVRSAMLIAASGEQWVKAFSTLNSGTYNNEYAVVDLNKFRPKVELQPGLLWVIEQLPGLIVAADMTDTLAHGHWGMYNVPSFAKIYNMSGYPDAAEAMRRDQQAAGTSKAHNYQLPISWLSYQSSPRAAIFRRDQGAVETLSDLKDLIRFNNYRKDKYSHGVAEASICGRMDLPTVDRLSPQQQQDEDGPAGARASSSRKLFARSSSSSSSELRPAKAAMRPANLGGAPESPIPSGCYDGKVTNYKLARQLMSEVVNGPTQSNGLPAFSWSEWDGASPGEYSHVGHPATFNFTFEVMSADQLLL